MTCRCEQVEFDRVPVRVMGALLTDDTEAFNKHSDIEPFRRWPTDTALWTYVQGGGRSPTCPRRSGYCNLPGHPHDKQEQAIRTVLELAQLLCGKWVA